jgi:hypothetical protein
MPLRLTALSFALLVAGLFPPSNALLQTSTHSTTLPVTVLPTRVGLPDEPAPTSPGALSVFPFARPQPTNAQDTVAPPAQIVVSAWYPIQPGDMWLYQRSPPKAATRAACRTR